MAQIPVLWPRLSVDAVTPVAILQVQAASLERLTRGILLGSVTKAVSGREEQLNLEVFAPAVGTRVRVVTVTNGQGQPYPARISWVGKSESLTGAGGVGGAVPLIRGAGGALGAIPEGDARNPEELEAKLREALGSSGVNSILHSLIARSNEATSVDTNTLSGDADGPRDDEAAVGQPSPG